MDQQPGLGVEWLQSVLGVFFLLVLLPDFFEDVLEVLQVVLDDEAGEDLEAVDDDLLVLGPAEAVAQDVGGQGLQHAVFADEVLVVLAHLGALPVHVLVLAVPALDLQTVHELLLVLLVPLVPHVGAEHRHQHPRVHAGREQQHEGGEEDGGHWALLLRRLVPFVGHVVVTDAEQRHEGLMKGHEQVRVAAEHCVGEEHEADEDGPEGDEEAAHQHVALLDEEGHVVVVVVGEQLEQVEPGAGSGDPVQHEGVGGREQVQQGGGGGVKHKEAQHDVRHLLDLDLWPPLLLALVFLLLVALRLHCFELPSLLLLLLLLLLLFLLSIMLLLLSIMLLLSIGGLVHIIDVPLLLQQLENLVFGLLVDLVGDAACQHQSQ